MKINVHAGHNPDGKIACGAVGLIKESTQARKVVSEVIKQLKAAGHTAYSCTCNNGTSQSDVLNKIVTKCNAHSVDLNASIHFNSGASDKKGNGETTGVEVLIYSNDSEAKKAAERIAKNISSMGFKNRGVKVRPDLFVLKHTKAPALLVECCFVDDKDDVELYNAEKMARAIVRGIIGTEGTLSEKAITTKEGTAEKKKSSKKVKVNAKNGLNCRKGPGTSYGKVCAFQFGKELTITEEKEGWGKCSKGWVLLKYTK